MQYFQIFCAPHMQGSPNEIVMRPIWALPVRGVGGGNFLGRNSLILGGLNPCQDGLGHLFRNEVPQSARWRGRGCKSYLGNAQIGRMTISLGLPIEWIFWLKNSEHPPPLFRETVLRFLEIFDRITVAKIFNEIFWDYKWPPPPIQSFSQNLSNLPNLIVP